MDAFSALSDPTRRGIVEMLARKGALSATEISRQFKMSPPAVSQHLKILREAGVIEMEKRAQQRIYRVNPAVLQEVEQWASQLLQVWSQRFEALDALIEVEKQKSLSVNKDKEQKHE